MYTYVCSYTPHCACDLPTEGKSVDCNYKYARIADFFILIKWVNGMFCYISMNSLASAILEGFFFIYIQSLADIFFWKKDFLLICSVMIWCTFSRKFPFNHYLLSLNFGTFRLLGSDSFSIRLFYDTCILANYCHRDKYMYVQCIIMI